MVLLDGKYVAGEIRKELKAKVDELVAAGQRVPCLGIVLVGYDLASKKYVANKLKACAEVGIEARKIALEDRISEAVLLECVAELNQDARIDGFIVQLPLPKHINEQRILAAIAPHKDVDRGVTSRGIAALLSHYGISTEGKHVVVIGSRMLVSGLDGVTVTECEPDAVNLREECLKADILIAAAGRPRMVTADMVREGAIVIDGGFNRVEIRNQKSEVSYKLVGDVDFEHVAPKCAYITPMPGGVGPMTIAGLLLNAVEALGHLHI